MGGNAFCIYIQYASDPLVFFSENLYRTEPDWLREPKGKDVSEHLTWYPVITFLQLLFDFPMADQVPRGFAHSYSASSYLDAWYSVSNPEDWNIDTYNQLKEYFNQRALKASKSH